MTFWDRQAELLGSKLLQNMPALMLHFLRTASQEQITELAGETLPTSINARTSIIAHLVAVLADQTASSDAQVSPEAARAIQANCFTKITGPDRE